MHYHNEGLNGGARLDDRRVGSPVMIVARLLAIVAMVVVTAGLSATAARADSPAVGKSFTLPAGGFDPDVAVDDDGIANVVWAHQNPIGQSDTLEYCRIPRGQTTCDQRDSFTPPVPADDSKAEGRPRVLLQVSIMSCCSRIGAGLSTSTRSPAPSTPIVRRTADASPRTI